MQIWLSDTHCKIQIWTNLNFVYVRCMKSTYNNVIRTQAPSMHSIVKNILKTVDSKWYLDKKSTG